VVESFERDGEPVLWLIAGQEQAGTVLALCISKDRIAFFVIHQFQVAVLVFGKLHGVGWFDKANVSRIGDT
jgi:fumarate reductase subunit D